MVAATRNQAHESKTGRILQYLRGLFIKAWRSVRDGLPGDIAGILMAFLKPTIGIPVAAGLAWWLLRGPLAMIGLWLALIAL